MNQRERIRTIIAGGEPDRTAFWLGNPQPESWEQYHAYFGTSSKEELRQRLGDGFRWVWAGEYKHPDGLDPFPIPGKVAHGHPGPFADASDARAVDEYEWPTVDYLDFSVALDTLRQAGDVYRASGMWAPFYHDVMDLFGMTTYMMNMYEKPALVQAVTDRVCAYYYEANERYFDLAGDLMDGYFFGNDFGTQRGLICGPAQFDQFILPWYEKFTEQARRRGYQVLAHSCGSIHRVIDRLIAAGVQCLHPLQALAHNMDAQTLAQDFKGQIAFMGGIDTQNLLVNGTPDEVRHEVARVKAWLGPNLIVSPSHEALLPDIPPANIEAMAQAALE